MTTPVGRLVAFEGIDGCGKSTQAERLAVALGIRCTHEPGATAVGQVLRGLVVGDGATNGTDHVHPVPRAEALLLAADKAQHVTEILRPSLAAGDWVVTDRFVASTLAYQGFGQGLPVSVLGSFLDWAVDGLEPDLTVLIDVPLDVARARLTATPDRLERMDDGFFARVRAGYLRMAHEHEDRWVVVDGAPPVDVVAAGVAAAVHGRLGHPPPSGRGRPPSRP